MTEQKSKQTKLDIIGHELFIQVDEVINSINSPVVPMLMKVLIPVACCLNIVGLWVAILGQGALEILITFGVASMQTNTIELVPVSVISSINDAWSSGAWPLAVLIGTASCAWPIVKNFMLLLLWFTPGTIVTQRNRSKILEFLDIAGKWSFLDVFVVVVTLAALDTYVTLSSQDELEFLDPQFFETDAKVRPDNGIVILSSIAATSLLVNHVMAFYHRKTVEHYRKQFDKIAGNPGTPDLALKPQPLASYKFAKRRISNVKIRMMLILNALSGFLILAGIFLPVIRFEQKGLLGLLVQQIDSAEATKQYSVFTLGLVISEAPAGTFYERFVVVLFQFLYFIVAIIGPTCQIIALWVLLAGRFSLKNLDTLLEMTMIISFWAALDVVFVGIVVTLLEIEQVTLFIVDFITSDICSNVKSILEAFIPIPENASCFNIIGFLEITSAPYIVGLAGQFITLVITTILANQVLQHRYYKSYVQSGLRPREKRPPKRGFLRGKIFKFMTVPRSIPDQRAQEARLRRFQESAAAIQANVPSDPTRVENASTPESREVTVSNRAGAPNEQATTATGRARILTDGIDIFSEMETEMQAAAPEAASNAAAAPEKNTGHTTMEVSV